MPTAKTAKASTVSSGAIASHFGPSTTLTPSGAATEIPKYSGQVTSMISRTALRNEAPSRAGSSCIRE